MAKTRSIQIILEGRNRARRMFRQAGRMVRSLTRNLFSLKGAAVAALGGFGLQRLASALTSTFADFQFAMSEVKAITRSTRKEMSMLEEVARDLGKQTIFTAKQAANAMAEFARAGFSVREIARSMKPTLSLAAAGNLEIANAASITAKLLRAFELETSQLKDAMDVLTFTFTNATITMKDLGEAFKFAAPVVKEAGFSVIELNAAIAAMVDRGIQASTAGRGFRQVILKLADQTKEATKQFKDLGINIDTAGGGFKSLVDLVRQFQNAMGDMGPKARLEMLGKVFEARAASAFSTLIGAGSQKLKEFITQARKVGGLSNQVANDQLDNLKGSWIKLKAAMQEAAIAIVDEVSPQLRSLVVFIRKEVVPAMKPVAKGWIQSMRDTAIAVINWKNIWTQTVLQIKVSAQEMALNITQNILSAGNIVRNTMFATANFVKKTAMGMWQVIKNAFHNFWQLLKNSMTAAPTILRSIQKVVLGLIKIFLEGIRGFIQNIAALVVGGIRSLFSLSLKPLRQELASTNNFLRASLRETAGLVAEGFADVAGQLTKGVKDIRKGVPQLDVTDFFNTDNLTKRGTSFIIPIMQKRLDNLKKQLRSAGSGKPSVPGLTSDSDPSTGGDIDLPGHSGGSGGGDGDSDTGDSGNALARAVKAAMAPVVESRRMAGVQFARQDNRLARLVKENRGVHTNTARMTELLERLVQRIEDGDQDAGSERIFD